MKSKPLTLRQISKNFRKFQRDMKAAFDASPFSFAASVKAENLVELKNAIVNGDLVTVKQILKEYPGMVNEVERLFSLTLLFLTYFSGSRRIWFDAANGRHKKKTTSNSGFSTSCVSEG
jgi:hypothetical protein